MANLKTNMANAWESTLSSALAANATTINVTDTTGSPAVPFYVVLDPGNDAKREVVLVNGAKTATTFTLSAATSRGQDGTSDVAHDSGAVIAIVPIAAWFHDLHDRVDTKAADADVVKIAGAQTITGAKTFSVDPVLADGSSALSVTEGNAAYLSQGSEASVNTAESTTSTSYTALATAGPSVTLDLKGGRPVLVVVSALLWNSTTSEAIMGFAVSGANTLASADARALRKDDTIKMRASVGVLVTGLVDGSTTFTAQYRAGTGTANFANRNIAVMEL